MGFLANIRARASSGVRGGFGLCVAIGAFLLFTYLGLWVLAWGLHFAEKYSFLPWP